MSISDSGNIDFLEKEITNINEIFLVSRETRKKAGSFKSDFFCLPFLDLNFKLEVSSHVGHFLFNLFNQGHIFIDKKETFGY